MSVGQNDIFESAVVSGSSNQRTTAAAALTPAVLVFHYAEIFSY